MKKDVLKKIIISTLILAGIAVLFVPIYITNDFNLVLALKIIIGIVFGIALLSAFLEIATLIRLIINTNKILSHESSFLTNLVYSSDYMKYLARSMNVNDVEFSNGMKTYYDVIEINTHINFGEYNTAETKFQELNLQIMSQSASAGYYCALAHYGLLAHSDTQSAVDNYKKAYTIAKKTNKAKNWDKSDARLVALYLEMSQLLNITNLNIAQVKDFEKKVSKVFFKNELVYLYWGLASMYVKLNDQERTQYYLDKCKKIAPYHRAYYKAMAVSNT